MKRRFLGHLGALAAVSLCWQASAAPAPQDPAEQRLTSVLSHSEQRRLNHLAREWFEAEDDYVTEERNARRDRLREAAREARRDFSDRWDRASEKHGDLLAHVGDLRAIFEGVYPYPHESGYGAMKSAETPAGVGYKVVPPRGYRESDRYPAVLVLPEREVERERWLPPSDQFDAVWKHDEFASEAVLVYPELSDDVLLDGDRGVPAAERQNADEARIAAVLAPFGAAGTGYHFDRSRLLLDCSKGSSAFGLRLATYFPVLFAGIVLRHPVEPADLRLDSLSGIPVLLLKSPETRSACAALAAKLEELHPGCVTVVDAGDTEDVEGHIATWARGLRRDLYPAELAIGVNHDRFKKSFWIVVDRAEPLSATDLEDRPHLVARADRAANRITVECQGIASFTVLLNDVLVDLDHEVTVIVNGDVAVMKHVPRRFSTMVKFIRQRRDPTNLFVATLPVVVDDSDRGDER